MEKKIANELAMSTGLMGGSDGLEEGLGDFEAEGCTIGAYKTTSTMLRSICSTGTMTLYIYIHTHVSNRGPHLGGFYNTCSLQGLSGPRP